MINQDYSQNHFFGFFIDLVSSQFLVSCTKLIVGQCVFFAIYFNSFIPVPSLSASEALRNWHGKNHKWLELADVHRETTESIRITVIPFFMGSRVRITTACSFYHNVTTDLPFEPWLVAQPFENQGITLLRRYHPEPRLAGFGGQSQGSVASPRVPGNAIFSGHLFCWF